MTYTYMYEANSGKCIYTLHVLGLRDA